MLASREIMRLPLDLRQWKFGRKERVGVFCCGPVSVELVELVERVGDGSGWNVVDVGVVGSIGDTGIECAANMPDLRARSRESPKHVSVRVIASSY